MDQGEIKATSGATATGGGGSQARASVWRSVPSAPCSVRVNSEVREVTSSGSLSRASTKLYQPTEEIGVIWPG